MLEGGMFAREAKKRSISTIDLMRFGCALYVVFTHFFALTIGAIPIHLVGAAGLPHLTLSAPRFANAGWIGVEIFFVISGRVIAASAVGKTPYSFARARVMRLLPAAWICATITALVALECTGFPRATLFHQWAKSLILLPKGELIDPSYWTLSVEIAFYVVVGLLLRWSNSATSIERLVSVIGLLSALFWLAYYAVPLEQVEFFSRPFMMTLLPHGCFFALGTSLWAREELDASRARNIFTLAMFLACLAEIFHHQTEARFPSFLSGDLRTYLPMPLFGLGVFLLMRAADLQRHIEKVVEPRTAAFLGLMSYASTSCIRMSARRRSWC